MKIAIVYDLIFPFSIGGAESRNFSLAQHLVLKGHEVHLFGAKMWKGKDTIKAAKNLYVHGVSRYSGKYSFSGNRKIYEPIFYSFRLFFRLLKYDFDIIDASAFPYFPALSCKLYSLIKRTPLVVTWHEFWDEYWKKLGIAGWFGRPVEKLLALVSKNNICVSSLTAKRLKKITGKDSKIIENWIETEEIRKAVPSRQEYDIISVGRHMKHKNFGLLLKVCSILVKDIPRLRVLILGKGPETITLLRMRKALSLEKNVEILGFTKEKQEMYSYLKSSKIFVLLSELEGFSIVAFEAMAAGLPVITLKSENNALNGFIREIKNGFVVNNELEAANRISGLLKDKKMQKKMCEYSKNFAKDLDAHKQIKKIEHLYEAYSGKEK
ncbi:glycosyltransferase family 4 protein [Candidatus Woesearchaeota archaeon]|nr:glycosyltransferase family 4 protein [Candidatus Woesearchaeota archaeon]